MEPLKPPPIPKKKRRDLVLWAVGLLIVCYLAAPLVAFLWGYVEWKMAEAKLRGKGEKLTFQEIVPSTMVPDAENFFSDPVWDELKDMVPDQRKSSLTPRLKEGERQLDRLNPLLTSGEIGELKEKYPEVVWPEHSEKRMPVAMYAWAHQPEENSPEEKRHVAAFVMEVLEPSRPFLEKLRALAVRPKSYFPVKYEEGTWAALPHVQYMLAGAQMLSIRARAEIALGQQERAFDDIQLSFRLERVFRKEPVLIALLVRRVCLDYGIVDLADGLKSHAWEARQLRGFLNLLSGVDLMADLPGTLRGERMSFNATIVKMRKKGNIYNDMKSAMALPPSEVPEANRWSLGGLFYIYSYRDQATYNELMQEFIEEVQGVSRRGIPQTPSVKAKLATLRNGDSGKANKLLTVLSLPALLDCELPLAETQDRIGMARVACALELYWLNNGYYPETVAELTPKFLDSLPIDVVDLNPFKYKRKSPGEYLLYSVGPDRGDDDGRPTDKVNHGDWVWGITKRANAPQNK